MSKKNFFFIVLLILSIRQTANCQTTFFKTYGDTTENHNDIGFSVVQTDDGCYVAAGVTNDYIVSGPPWIFEGDVYLLKTDENGDTLWTKRYGEQNLREIAYSICSTDDGGFILSAYNSEQLWLIRTDSKGDSLWSKKYPVGTGNCIQRTNDDGYIITGKNPGIYLLKINSEGDSLWLKSYGGLDGRSVQQTTDNGYMIVGFKNISEGIWLIKTDSQGDTLWTKTYSDDKPHEPFSICETNDGGYFVTGAYTSQDCEDCELELHIWLFKIDSNGDTSWTKKIDIGYWDLAIKGKQTTDGGYIIAGQTVVDYKDYIYIVKLGTKGDIEWSNTIIGEKYDNSIAYDIDETLDGGYIITGYTGFNMCLVKVNDKGQLTDVKEEVSKVPTDFILLQNYPNPFNPSTTIKYELKETTDLTLKIYDSLGRLIKVLEEVTKPAGRYELQFNGSNLSSGIYFYQLKGDNFSFVKKMLLIK